MARKKKTAKPRKIEDYRSRLGAALKRAATADKLLLACDPGSKNFGIALVGLERGRVKVYANAVMMYPVDNLVNFNESSKRFLREISFWMRPDPSGIVAERFQTRGNLGPLVEMVSSMLGLMRGHFNKPVKLTIASTWKNRFNRRFQTDLKEIYPTVLVQPHQLDASLIGVFGLEEGLQKTLAYTPADIIKQVEATSLIPLKVRK